MERARRKTKESGISADDNVIYSQTVGRTRMPFHYRGGITVMTLRKEVHELRRRQTTAEAVMWRLLRDRQLCGAKFRRQHQFGIYICDFFCYEAGLVVEIDGAYHDTVEQRQTDARRSEWLTAQGCTVLRFTNEEVFATPDKVLNTIADKLVLHRRAALPSPAPSLSRWERDRG